MSIKVLVTGGAGFIGHHLVNELLRYGYKVTVLDDLSMGKIENVSQKAKLIIDDIRDSKIVKTLLSETDILCHLAAKVSIRNSLQNFFEDASVNLMGTLNLLNNLQNTPVKKVCFASSMAVYADSSLATPISENHPTIPISPYGQSKKTAEYYVETVAKELGINWFNLRLFNTYGPGQSYTPYVGVMTIFAKRIADGKPPIIFDDGKQSRDFVHVKDIVQGWIKAIDSPSNINGTFNIGTGIPVTVNEIAQLMLDALNSPLRPIYQPAHHLELHNSIADISAAKRKLNYAPTKILRKSLSVTIKEILNSRSN